MIDPAASAMPVEIRGTGAFDYELASVGRFQAALRRVVWSRRTEAGAGILCQAQLVPEPENGNDSNAIRVEIGEETVGYIRHTHSARYQAAMRELGLCGRAVVAKARVSRSSRHGVEFESFQVKLDLAWPPRI